MTDKCKGHWDSIEGGVDLKLDANVLILYKVIKYSMLVFLTRDLGGAGVTPNSNLMSKRHI